MTGRELRFEGGVRTAVGFLLVFTALSVVLVPVKAALPEGAGGLAYGVEVAQFLTLGGIGFVFLRADGVGLGEVGVGRRHLGPALAVFTAVWVVLNVYGVGVALAVGNQWGVASLSNTSNPEWASLPAPWVASVALQFLLVGVIEEFVFRGYFQTKVLALLGADGWRRTALGIGVASALFGLAHVPGAALDGASLGGMAGTAAFLAGSGVAFGTLYEVTGNVLLVALLHALGNTWVLLVDPWKLTGLGPVAFLAGVGVVYVVAAVVYRRWVSGTDRAPPASRRDSALSAVEL